MWNPNDFAGYHHSITGEEIPNKLLYWIQTCEKQFPALSN